MSVKSIGGITDLKQNTSVTFFGKLGYLHLIAGFLFLNATIGMLWDSSWVTFDTVEHVIGGLMFIAGMWGVAYAFGCGLEELQIWLLKATQFNWTDAWWTSFGFPLFLIVFFFAPPSWLFAIGCVSWGLLLIMGVSYILYRRKNAGR